MPKYKTLSDAINDLEEKGYHHDCNLEKDSLYSTTLRRSLSPDEVYFTGYFRFDGAANPGDNEIIFTVKTRDGHKGLLVCPYRVYSESKFTPPLVIEQQDGVTDSADDN